MQIINGKKIVAEIISRLKALPKPNKFIGAALVGDDSVSRGFLKQKSAIADELGVEFRLYNLPRDISTDDLRGEIGRLSRPKNCGGFIVQLPLPENINRHYALNAIPKEKDVDMLSESALGAFYTGRSRIVPPSVGTVNEILSRERSNLRELSVVLMGLGFLTGKPIGFWLQRRVAELTIVDERAKSLRTKIKEADVVISGVGEAGLFKVSDLKDGALVIDFGYSSTGEKSVSGKLIFRGDFDSSSIGSSDKISYTPTPGGTGPILVAKLFENFYALNSDSE